MFPREQQVQGLFEVAQSYKSPTCWITYAPSRPCTEIMYLTDLNVSRIIFIFYVTTNSALPIQSMSKKNKSRRSFSSIGIPPYGFGMAFSCKHSWFVSVLQDYYVILFHKRDNIQQTIIFKLQKRRASQSYWKKKQEKFQKRRTSLQHYHIKIPSCWS